MLRPIVLGCVLFVSVSAAAQDASAPDTLTLMSSKEIAAHNASLDPSDKTFIKCVRSERPGSLVKKRYCRTNADWDRRAEIANRDARDIVDRILTSGSTHGEEPAGSLVPAIPN